MKNIIKEFLHVSEFTDIVPFGGGHINDTFAVSDINGERKWILQRVNHHVFPRIEVLQNNIEVVSNVMRDRLLKDSDPDIDRKHLKFIKLLSDSSKNYYFDGENYWRMCQFIPRSKTLTEMNEKSAATAGEAFGKFEEMLSSIPEGVLGETIINFHSMPWRLQQLDEAVKLDKVGRVAEVKDILDEIYSRRDKMLIQEDLYQKGLLPKRTIHCDTKVDNVLFDEDGSVLCVIDWDTVMPGFILSDVGDFIRTAVSTAAEDEADLNKIEVNMPIYKAFVEGYLSTAGKFLNEYERSLIAYGGRLMTYMQTVRFLADYLDGDNYFKIHHPKHNLQRTKAQLQFLKKLEEKAEEMEALLK